MEGHLELGHIFQFIFYVNLLTWPFASVGWVTSLVQKAEASMARILHFLDTEPEIVSESSVKSGAENNFKAEYNPSAGLVFKDVGFTYSETGIKALEGVNFTLEAGTTVAITGRTGSGKSTILQLVMRMMDPTEGSISFKGAELGIWKLDKYREHTGYVPQDVFLFSDTIENNISFGVKEFKSKEREKERITESALDAGVLEDIEGFEHGFETLLGERGVNLSGGQKQRISIARALIREPELLILDDCLSAVDVITEKHILGRLKKGNDARSTLVVSHRISTIKDADLILVIEEGQIVERGTHQELIRTGGLYAEMDKKQESS
jgi:ATP-binding cassette subfamily B multidrug efflux pump